MRELCLVLNLGSSSLKAALVDPTGACPWQKSRSLQPSDELDWVLDSWLAPQLKPFRDHIDLIAHRVVHGGEQFTAPTLIDRVVEKTLQELIPLAPLHNPPALRGLAWSRGWAPSVPQWACFDTAFHSSLPASASSYAIPTELRCGGFRRFGFHGINHQHVSESVARQWREQGKDPAQLRLISAHLGAGASLAAIRGGICIDTTMGYTPLEGLVMATRSGSVDPGLLLDLMRKGYSADQIASILQEQSGLKGLSDLSGDMQEIRSEALAGHNGAIRALAVFKHRLLQLIGSMAASLRGADVLALTGGIGEHDVALLGELKLELKWLPGLDINVVEADEEGMIAKLCRRHSTPSRSAAVR